MTLLAMTLVNLGLMLPIADDALSIFIPVPPDRCEAFVTKIGTLPIKINVDTYLLCFPLGTLTVHCGSNGMIIVSNNSQRCKEGQGLE